MKNYRKIFTLSLSLAIGTFMFSCAQKAQQQASADAAAMEQNADNTATEARTKAGKAVDETISEIQNLSSWVKEKSTQAKSATKEDWKELKEQYKEQEATLEAKSSTWNEKAKKEWKELKREWKKTEKEADSRLK